MNVSEEIIRNLAIKGLQVLGTDASPSQLQAFVEKELAENPMTADGPINTKSGDRVIITAFGLNHPGVVSMISTALSNQKCDIQDISQKIMQEFFTMIMLIDMSNSSANIRDLQEAMNKIADQLKIKIYLQHEDVFKFMHRI